MITAHILHASYCSSAVQSTLHLTRDIWIHTVSILVQKWYY